MLMLDQHKFEKSVKKINKDCYNVSASYHSAFTQSAD